MGKTKEDTETCFHPARWPEKLNRQGQNGEIDLTNAIDESRKAFEAFNALLASCAADKNLSAAGRRAKLEKFVNDRGPALLAFLPKIEERTGAVEASRKRLMDEQQAQPAVEPADIAMMQEIRTWLRSVPEVKRADAVRHAIEAGDGSMLRAVLTGPAYLTDVDAPTLRGLRDDLFERANPERAEKMRLFPLAARQAQIAVNGALEYMGDVIARQVEPPPRDPRVGYLPAHPHPPVR